MPLDSLLARSTQQRTRRTANELTPQAKLPSKSRPNNRCKDQNASFSQNLSAFLDG